MTEVKKKVAKAAKAPKAPKAPKVAKVAKPKIVRERQNGQTRPQAGSKTGIVWDVADEISSKLKRPALRNEVFDAYEKKVKDASMLTAGTQYSRWCTFYGVAKELSKFKADARKERDAEAKQEKADKKAAAEKAKAEKEAKAEQKKAA